MNKIRSASGANLVELLVVVLVMTFVSTAAFGMLVSTMGTQVKTQNKCDSIDSTRKVLERVGQVMRMGRSLTGACTATTMVVQVPKFDDNGYPYQVGGVDAVETHTFAVVQDAVNINGQQEYMLTWAKDAGPNVPASTNPALASMNTSFGAAPLVKGIIGPAGGAVFQYINRNNPAVPVSTLAGVPQSDLDDYTGATVTMEILEHKNTANNSGGLKNTAILSYKTEVFMRNNSNMCNNTVISSNP